MNNVLNTISLSFDKRDLNARFIVTFVLIIVIFLIWLFALVMPLSRTISATTKKLKIVQQNSATLTTIYDNYQLIIHSPTDAAEKKIQTLEEEITKLQRHPLLMKKVISTAEDLRKVLQAISKTGATISLGQIQILSADPVTAPKNTVLINQKIAVEFTGNYFDTIQYLNTLDNLPWYLSFDSLEYQVDEYPNARVKLIVNALSTEQGVGH